MLKRKLKKAFTLVELLVVIAILAILATVSVVGYTQFTKRAHLSNDQSTIGMINDNLRAASVGNEPESASDALSLLYTVGFTNEKLVAYSSGYHYAYDSADNMFYLLDDNDNIVFPEEKSSKSTLWGLYRNQNTDKISGVTNYVAMTPIVDKNKTVFDSVFGTGSENAYVIDLNSYYIGIENTTGKTITLINGSVNEAVQNGYEGVENDDSLVARKEASAEQTGGYGADGGRGVIENYVFAFGATADETPAGQAQKLANMQASGFETTEYSDDGQTETVVVLKDCVLMEMYSANIQNWSGVDRVVIENCMFVGARKWSIQIGSTDTVYEIRNNLFYNCDRGINILGVTTEGNVIENNDFILSNSAKSKALQIASYVKSDFEGLADDVVFVTFRNNTIQSGVAVINPNENMVHEGKDQNYVTRDFILREDIKHIITFENNHCEDVTNIAASDEPDNPFTAAEQAEIDYMVSYWASIFN